MTPWELVIWADESMLESAEWRDTPAGDEVEATICELWVHHFSTTREPELDELLRCGVTTVMLGKTPITVSYELREVGSDNLH